MLQFLLRLLLTLLLLPAMAWGLLALHYQLPFNQPQNLFIQITWLGLGGYALFLLWNGFWKTALILYLVLHGELLLWWEQIQPSHERNWADDVAQMTTGQIEGNLVTLHNVRNFDWRSPTDYATHWETRQYDLSRLRSVDMITSHWGMASIAHVLVSFGFDDGSFVTFTVEIRKEKGEEFSELGGFFKQFELSILATDERDAVAVRPNVRGEDSYLYRIAMPAQVRRALFLAYVERANQLAAKPRFYNTITVNCTTLVYSMMQQISGGFPLDIRLLLTGYLPSYIKAQDGLMSGFDLQELRQLGHINSRSRSAAGQDDYSLQIRQGVPGWLHEPEPQPARPESSSYPQGLPF